MLKGVETEVGQFGYLFVRAPDAEYATGILRASIQPALGSAGIRAACLWGWL